MELFWDSTLLDLMESRERMIKAEEKRASGRVFVLANAISTRIGYLFTDPKERTEDMILQAWDAYPELYEKEKQKAEEKKAESRQEEQRLKIMDRAARVNAYRHRKEALESDS